MVSAANRQIELLQDAELDRVLRPPVDEAPNAHGDILRAMPAEQYHAVRALSNHGMKLMAISPLHYWHCEINPNRKIDDEGSPETKFGSALHCLVLEGEKRFNECYAEMLCEDDYPEALHTIEDVRRWIRDKGHTPTGTRKDQLIIQACNIDRTVQVWDVMTRAHEMQHGNKMLCLREDWRRIRNCANALLSEPKLQSILKEGIPEVSIFTNEPETGTPIKARLDWLNPTWILDLKTFSQWRGKSIDQTIAEAIYYEGYYRQSYLYANAERWATGAKKLHRTLIAFVESEEPHEVRLREIKPANHGTANVYWQKAQIEVRHFCDMWAHYMREYGEKPWRREQDIEALVDEEIPALRF